MVITINVHKSITILLSLALTGSSTAGLWLDGADIGPISRDIDTPASEKIYDQQRVNHFDGSDFRFWKQRYFVSNTYFRSGGPVFLVVSGQQKADPAWITDSSVAVYAQQHGAALVMLEHRYYGLSRPVEDLTTPNLKFLSSRQALADLSRFIVYYRQAANLPSGTKIILFGTGYAGALATWFRAQYPYLATGAVTSSAPIVALYDYQDFYVSVGEVLDMTGPGCQENIANATTRMYDWWGQPDKRELMRHWFRLCHKINHDSLIDVTVFFYDLARNFADVVLHSGLPNNTHPAITKMCDVMTDVSRGDPIQRYGDVNSLLLDTHGANCLDIRYSRLENYLRQTEWNSTTAQQGGRQAMYQRCAEFGWAKSSWSRKQPFGPWFTFPWNYTMDKCDSAFRFLNVDENVQETNAYYGGLDLQVDHVIFANGKLDPWRTVGVTKPLPNSPNVDIILIPGVSHGADMYPPTPDDRPELTEARRKISVIIGHWLADKN